MDSARATVGRTKDAVPPYTSAMETARHYAGEAKNRLAPTLDAATAQARTGAAQARRQYQRHLAPQLGNAFSSLPPHTQQNTLKAVHRAQEAALAAKISAAKAADQARTAVAPKVTIAVEGARTTVLPVAQEAQARGAAALTALHGHVSAAEISQLAEKNIKKEQRGGWATGLAVAGTLAIGAGALAWQWWRKQSNPEWLVEPPTGDAPQWSARTETGIDSAPMDEPAGSASGAESADHTQETPQPTPKPGPPPDKSETDRPKPHDPRKPH